MDVKAPISVSVAQQPQSAANIAGDMIVGGKAKLVQMLPWIVVGVLGIVGGLVSLAWFKHKK